MITPGRFLLSLLAAASICVDVAIAANLHGSEPSEGLFGCMLGLMLGQIGLIAAGWIRRPEAWPVWSIAMLGSIALGSTLLATIEKIPLLHWAIVLGVFAVLSVALPLIYRIGRREATSQFSLAAIFALTTGATLVCLAVLQSDFPWQELPVALPGLMVWSCPTMVVALTLCETKEDRQRQLVIGLGAILAISLTAAWMLPALWNRMPLVIAWESFYLLIAGIVALQAIRNDEVLAADTVASDS
ncbi:hypothetical protein Pan97_00170 [Bremerella volcania]|uniref:Uncharacterized protein n=1 Tax=Bremerella volcania TaxID=2527984 RepID=A0A518C1F6_9BACT|nr:hypothetical protein [Bremerella volcania]QDU73050.1 hypothetical protein Pan97_00170 [Bremerella volcania]